MEKRLYKKEVINCPRRVVYETYAKGFGDEYLFNSSLRNSEPLRQWELNQVVGTAHKCWFKDSKYFIMEKITKAMENTRLVVSLLKTNLPIKDCRKVIEFKSLSNDVTEVSYTLSYHKKKELFGLFSYKDEAERSFDIEHTLKDLKEYLEQGKLMNQHKLEIVYL
jgi:hypothetical protein